MAEERFWEFFTVHLRNRNTRRAYLRVAVDFSAWCGHRGVSSLGEVRPMHVAAYIEGLQARLTAPSIKQHLAALRMLFDWLVVQQVIEHNPAHAVRGPRHSVGQGKTPVLTTGEARRLLDCIDAGTAAGRRDRALTALMLYTFARVGAALAMNVGDAFIQMGSLWVRLREKGGKQKELPCHPVLTALLEEYLAGGGFTGQPDEPLFRTGKGRGGRLSIRRMTQADAHQMIRRRAVVAGIRTVIGCHTLRATGITAYLKNGGSLESAQYIAGHESPRTTKLYDRRVQEVTLAEIQRISI